jgi:hypothetical protein
MRRFPKPKPFKPKNPSKYVGDVHKIICRSGIELRYMKYFDETTAVTKWASEKIVIPYVNPLDGQVHRYFPDFMVQILTKGQKRNYLIEIKSSGDTVQPVKGKRASKTFITEQATWSVNNAKWKAAKAFCAKHNMTFMVLTEKEIKFKF